MSSEVNQEEAMQYVVLIEKLRVAHVDVIAMPVMLPVQQVVVVALLEHTQQANQIILTKVGHVHIQIPVVQPLLPIVIVPVAVNLGLLQIVI